jgi:hypothetical protein
VHSQLSLVKLTSITKEGVHAFISVGHVLFSSMQTDGENEPNDVRYPAISDARLPVAVSLTLAQQEEMILLA